MKRLFFILFCLMAYSCTNKTTTVTLNIKSNTSGELCVMLPIDGVAQIAALDTVCYSGDTTIQIPIQTKGGLVSMLMFGKGGERIQTVCGDGDFTIVYNPTDTINPIVYKGLNSEGRALLQKIRAERDPYKYEWVRNFDKYPLDTVAARMSKNFDKLLSDDAAKFDSLLISKSIDKQFYDYAKLDAEVYHALSLGKIINCNWISKQNSTKDMYEGYVECWDSVFQKLPITVDIFRMNYGTDYADQYIHNYSRFCDSKKGMEIKKFTSIVNYLDDVNTRIDTLLQDEKLKRVYTGFFLFSEALNNKTRDTSITKYLDRYVADYPDSKLNNYFDSHKKELADYYQRVANADMSRIHLIENPDQITTLNDLIAKFKGRKLFIDFWFSSCGPCLQEFKHLAPLKSFLDEKGVDILYISTDKPNREKAWMNAIKYNQLSGTHIRTSQALHEDIYNVHGIYMFPTYMIVDENGKIVVSRAKYPSTGQELLTQLTESLKL